MSTLSQLGCHKNSVAILLCMAVAGCGSQSAVSKTPDSGDSGRAASESLDSVQPGKVLRVASTTSTRDSGLTDILLPMFEKQASCRVDLIAVGTGAALKLGETGDADAVFVHARADEIAFMEAGHGIRHEPVMHNFFMIVGPADDPAGIKNGDPGLALRTIASGQHQFVSRGDDSGTHKRELSLWRSGYDTGGRPDWSQYIETGQGMGATLRMADEMNAYLLIDEATWIRQGRDSRLVPLVTEAAELANPYAVMVVNPEKGAAVNASLANRFADFLIAPESQRVIADYEIDGCRLFHPDRLDN